MSKTVKIEIPEGTKPTACKDSQCTIPIFWVKTPGGKNMPVEASGTPHWANCCGSKEFKAKAEAKRAYDKRVAEINAEKKK